uniref:Uncharacterized protein n=1 Tax=Anguilla anguilla TaxID=7936 RepID=A0A0E9W0U8_ANGAN
MLSFMASALIWTVAGISLGVTHRAVS